MRTFLLFTLAMIANVTHGQGLFVESNFSDTQFTVRAQALDVVKADMPQFMETALITQLEVLESYQGDLLAGDTIELIIESDALNSHYRLARMQGEFLTSFCKSESGIYYTNIIFAATTDNIAALERYREHGTEYWDRHDCNYTNSKVKNPDDLDYEQPLPEYPESQSGHKWRVDTAFMSAFQATLKNRQIDNWVSDFNGVGQSHAELKLDGDNWTYISLCKIENCSVFNLSVLYNKKRNELFGLINDRKTFFTGNPPEQFKSALLSLHDKNYSKYNIEKRLYDTSYFNHVIAGQKRVQRARSKSPNLGETLIDIYVKQ